jgi:hypothetical protein
MGGDAKGRRLLTRGPTSIRDESSRQRVQALVDRILACCDDAESSMAVAGLSVALARLVSAQAADRTSMEAAAGLVSQLIRDWWAVRRESTRDC